MYSKVPTPNVVEVRRSAIPELSVTVCYYRVSELVRIRPSSDRRCSFPLINVVSYSGCGHAFVGAEILAPNSMAILSRRLFCAL